MHDAIDCVYYINLQSRPDRLMGMVGMLEEYQFRRAMRIEGVASSDGQTGCLRSHIRTLETFLETDYHVCVVLEDDFQFTQAPNTIRQAFAKFFQSLSSEDWDIVMLASNTLRSMPHNDFLDKCLEAQTTSGYMINRRFAPTLLKLWRAALPLLDERPDLYDVFGIDIVWKLLQPDSKWFIFSPKLGAQRPGYSDIVKTFVDYAC